MHTKTARARGKVRAQYRWAYATSTLIPLQENGQNEHEKGGWAFNTSWAYNTYSTVLHIVVWIFKSYAVLFLIISVSPNIKLSQVSALSWVSADPPIFWPSWHNRPYTG